MDTTQSVLNEHEFNKLKNACKTEKHTNTKPNYLFTDATVNKLGNPDIARKFLQSKRMLLEKHSTLWDVFPNALDCIASCVPVNILSFFETCYAGEMFSAWYCGTPIFNQILFVCLWAIWKWKTEKCYLSPFHVIEATARYYPERELKELRNWLRCAVPSPDPLFGIFKERDWSLLNFYRSCHYSLLDETRNTAQRLDEERRLWDPISKGNYKSVEFCKLLMEDLCDSKLWIKLKKRSKNDGFVEYRYTDVCSYFNAKMIAEAFTNKCHSDVYTKQIEKRLQVTMGTEIFANLESEQRSFVISSCLFPSNLCIGLPGVGKTHSTFVSQSIFENPYDPLTGKFLQRLSPCGEIENAHEEDESLFSEKITNYFALTTTGCMSDALSDLGFKHSSTLESFFLDVFSRMEQNQKRRRFDELKKCIPKNAVKRTPSPSSSSFKEPENVEPCVVTLFPKNVRLMGFTKESLDAMDFTPEGGTQRRKNVKTIRPKGRIFLDEFSNVGDEALGMLCRAIKKLKYVTGIEFGITCSFDPLQTLPIGPGMACLDLMSKGKSFDKQLQQQQQCYNSKEVGIEGYSISNVTESLKSLRLDYIKDARTVTCISKLTKPMRFLLDSDIYVADMLMICGKYEELFKKFKHVDTSDLFSRKREADPNSFRTALEMPHFPGTFNAKGQCEVWGEEGFLEDGINNSSNEKHIKPKATLTFYLECIHPIPSTPFSNVKQFQEASSEDYATWVEKTESFNVKYLQSQILALTNADCIKVNRLMKYLRKTFVANSYDNYLRTFFQPKQIGSNPGQIPNEPKQALFFAGDKILFSENFYFEEIVGERCLGSKKPRNGTIKTFSGIVGYTIEKDWTELTRHGLPNAKYRYIAELTEEVKRLNKETSAAVKLNEDFKLFFKDKKKVLARLRKEAKIATEILEDGYRDSEEILAIAEWLRNHRWFIPFQPINYSGLFDEYVRTGKLEGLARKPQEASMPFLSSFHIKRASEMMIDNTKRLGNYYIFFDNYSYCLSFCNMVKKFEEKDPNILHPKSWSFLQTEFSKYFLPGWCVTTDKSQGRQYEHTVLYVSSDEMTNNDNINKENEKDNVDSVVEGGIEEAEERTNKRYNGFDKSRGHVALTRPKRNFVLLGPPKEFLAICKRNERLGDGLSSALDCLLESEFEDNGYPL